MGRTPPVRRRGKTSPHRRAPPVKWGGFLRTKNPSASYSPGRSVAGGRGRHLSGSVSPARRASNRKNNGTPNSQQQHRGRGPGRVGVARRDGGEEKAELRPIPASEGSIYACLFRELGGLIRWYADARSGELDDAIKTVKSMYTQSGCSVEGTKELILRELSGESPGIKAEESEAGWIDLSMVVEGGVAVAGYEQSYDGGGLRLPTVDRAGDGPAHSHETWTNVIIPSWAVGESYYFTVHNKSPLDLSCEISIDGHAQKAAKNVPVPAGTKRTIKPEARYYGSHKWVFTRAERVKLQGSAGGVQAQNADENHRRKILSKRRCNGLRPKDYSDRVDAKKFPDPSAPPYYWKFTGSNEKSKVEFYEKQMNLGHVRMDFYYTTGTVKTVLDHPHGGVNDLFRMCAVDPTKFKAILLNPHAHTNIGYRTKEQRTTFETESANHSAGNTDAAMEVDEAPSGAATGETGADDESPAPTYWAKNDDYDFQRQGHANRKVAMGRLRPTDEFRAWEEAQKTEYACVHAKFFVSLAKRRSGRHNFRQAQRDPSVQSLPTMAPVVDVKASERAVLATEFRSEGGKGSMPSGSRVRMERVLGINDRPGWGTGPVFEQKLYYRIQHAGDGSDSEADENMGHCEDDPDIIRHNEILCENTPLDSYKEEKIGQLDKWHGELTFLDETTATDIQSTLTSSKDGIRAAQSVEIIDDQVKLYWDQHQKHQWRE